MSAKLNLKAFLFACIFLTTSFVGSLAVEQKPLNLDEIQSTRKSVRADLMLPSLTGMQGLAYRVVGYKDAEELEKLCAKKFEQLGVPCVSFLKMEEGYKPVDGIVQLSFYKAGTSTLGEVTLTQWVNLDRDPKIKVRAVTYKDRVFFAGHQPAKFVGELADLFVLDFLKANQKEFGAVKKSEGKAKSDKSAKEKPAKVEKTAKEKKAKVKK